MWPRWAGIWGLRWDIPGNITRIHGQPRTWSLKVLNPGYHFGSLNKKVTKSKISFEVKYKEVGFPCGSAGKKKIRLQCWRPWFDSWLGRSPGEGNSYPLQYSSLENFMDCIVHGVAKSWTWLSNFHFHKKVGICPEEKEQSWRQNPLRLQTILSEKIKDTLPTRRKYMQAMQQTRG